MIQINLIPDVKLEYLRARVMRNTAISISIAVGLVAAGVVALIGIILGGQTIREATIDSRIKEEHSKLMEIGPLTEALTLQNQLTKVSALNQGKTISSRVFQVLQAVNPGGENAVKFTLVSLSPNEYKISAEGIAQNGYPAAEALKKTIMNTKLSYQKGDETVEESLATNVVDGEASYGEDGNGQRVLRFAITVEFNSNLFSNKITSFSISGMQGVVNVTDSRAGVPESLFSVPAKDIVEGNR